MGHGDDREYLEPEDIQDTFCPISEQIKNVKEEARNLNVTPVLRKIVNNFSKGVEKKW